MTTHKVCHGGCASQFSEAIYTREKFILFLFFPKFKISRCLLDLNTAGFVSAGYLWDYWSDLVCRQDILVTWWCLELRQHIWSLLKVQLFTSTEVILDTYSWVSYRNNPNYPSNFYYLFFLVVFILFFSCIFISWSLITSIFIILNNQFKHILFLRENGECIEQYASGTKEEGFYASDCKYECFTGKSMFR